MTEPHITDRQWRDYAKQLEVDLKKARTEATTFREEGRSDKAAMDFLDSLSRRVEDFKAHRWQSVHHDADIHFHRDSVAIHLRRYASHHVQTFDGKTAREAIADAIASQ
jgi:hypothetical protein